MVATTTGMLLPPDDHASRPAANTVVDGALYPCTDHNLIYQADRGANTWSTWGVLGDVSALADHGAFTYLDGTEASAPSSPASGKARLYVKTDGRFYSKDDAGTEYGPFDAAGGGGAATGMPIDQVPVSPHADDDEFDGSVLGGAWSTQAVSDVVADGVVELTVGSSGIHASAIYKPSPTGSFKVMASMEYNDSYTFDIRAGIFVGVDGAKANVCGMMAQDGNCGVIGVTTMDTATDWSAYDGHLNGNSLGGARKCTVRIRWDAAGSTLYFGVWIGTGWSEFNSRGSMTQPDTMGIVIYGNGAFGAATPSIRVDWFRVEEP